MDSSRIWLVLEFGVGGLIQLVTFPLMRCTGSRRIPRHSLTTWYFVLAMEQGTKRQKKEKENKEKRKTPPSGVADLHRTSLQR